MMIKIHLDDDKIEKYFRCNIHKYYNYFKQMLNESKKKQEKKRKKCTNRIRITF